MSASQSTSDTWKGVASTLSRLSGMADTAMAPTERGPSLAPSVPPSSGTAVAERYETLGLLGEGGMGRVERVRDRDLLREVAVKRLLPELLANTKLLRQFLWEARVTAYLDHPNIVPVHDLGVTPEGHLYFTMKLVKGRTLEQELEKVREAGEVESELLVNRRLRLFLQLCNAVSFAHSRGVLHRDLKPANVMVGEYGEILVTDWGIAVPLPDESGDALRALFEEASVGVSAGTPLYMSPEQVRSAKHVDARADQWSLAVILFELLAGRPPFTGGPTAVSAAIVADDTPSLRELAPEVPAELEQVIGRALGKKPGQRYPDVAAFADALAPFGPEDGGRRRSRASHSGSFSVVEPLREQIRVDAPTLPRELAALSPTMPTPSLPDGSRDPRASKEFAEAVTAAPLSPPASLATGAPWSQSEARAKVAPKRRSPLLFGVFGLVGVGAAIGLFVALSPPSPSPSAGGPTAPSTTSNPASTPSITVGVGTLPAPPPSVSATVKPGVAETAKPATTSKPAGKPSASPSPSPPGGSSATGAPKPPPPASTGPENPVHL